jgi:hypothetical protein
MYKRIKMHEFIPRTTLHSDSEHYLPTLVFIILLWLLSLTLKRCLSFEDLLMS